MSILIKTLTKMGLIKDVLRLVSAAPVAKFTEASTIAQVRV
jgi:hypothetical protein